MDPPTPTSRVEVNVHGAVNDNVNVNVYSYFGSP